MEPIAIIGMACRFPQAPSLDAFWRLLSSGGDGIDIVPADRWEVDVLYDEDPKAPGKTNSRYGGFIENIDRFDAGFFGISPREAVQMDPQQRILIELAYEAFEDSGIPQVSLSGSDTGVFIGVMSNDYLRHQTAEEYRRIDVHTGGGAGFCMLANRLSYQFDLNGPSMAIDSACSSSLVTVFQGCQALWTGQSSLALAGGINLILDPAVNVFYTKSGLLAPDGRCKTFSANANGIGRGEGAGLVVLKRESDALRDGDAIYAVIRGGAVNHDGRSNGVTAPNRWAQEKLLRSAWRNAQVTGDQLNYVELHGTGTYIGDPIEANALGAELNRDGRRDRCLVGSVKSNIGHLEAAAGVAGLIKLALSLHNRTLVPSLWFDDPNPVIDFTTLPLEVNTTYRSWPLSSDDRSPLIAGISAFGLGGTNAHLVLQSAPVRLKSEELLSPAQSPHLLVISARSKAALNAQAAQFRDFFNQDIDITSVCMTALRRRNLHEYRLNVWGFDRQDLRQALSDYLSNIPNARVLSGRFKSRKQKIQVVITQTSKMATNRLALWLIQSPCGRNAWQSCRELLLSRGDNRLPSLETMAVSVVPEDDETRNLWCFAAQYAVLQQMIAALPSKITLVGEGFAQLAACCASGALSLSDALDWLHRGLHSNAPETGTHRIRCECMGVTNPTLDTLLWEPERESWLNRLTNTSEREVLTVLVNIDAAPLPIDALQCLGESENDFCYLFARLNMLCQLRLQSLAEDLFIRLPSYPWQRESYWIPRPTTTEAKPQTAVTVIQSQSVANATTSFRSRLLAEPVAAQEGLLQIYLRERVSEALRMATDDIDPGQPVNTLGIDSLTAVEIKNRIERDLKVTIPVVKFLDGFAVNDFAELILGELREIGATSSQLPQPVPSTSASSSVGLTDGINDKVAAMPIDQVDELLAHLMKGGH